MANQVVDIHPHIVSGDVERYPLAPLGGRRSEWSHERSVTLEQLLAHMDEAGIHKAAIVHSSTTYGFDCSYLADSIARHPGRLTGVFSVDALGPDATADMRRWIDRGCTGMRLFSRGSTVAGSLFAIDDPRLFPCYELAEEHALPIVTNITAESLGELETALKTFPGVKFIIDHMGKPDFTGGAPYAAARPLLRLAACPNLYLKVTSKNFADANKGKSTAAGMFGALVGAFGASRMAWGSNYPSYKGSLVELLALARAGLASLSSADTERILGGTALELYPSLASPLRQSAQGSP